MSEITLRDTVAIAAMQGLIQYMGCDPEAQFHGKEEKNKDVLTKSAYAYADAMLEERATVALKFLIRDLDLTTRTKNCLLAGDIISIGDLVQRTYKDLLKIRELGIRTLREIEDMLALRGLTLKSTH
jgi:DNA-directed RNA polymerase alpha subunit